MFHCWAAIGYNFKSDIHFYELPGNANGRLSQKAYIEQILGPVVKPWIASNQGFVLEKDGDSDQGPSKPILVRMWKEQNGLEYCFNCAQSLGLSPIENCWQPPKQQIKKYSHWDDQTTKELIIEGWDFVNFKVNSMPTRLQDALDSECKLTGYYKNQFLD